MSDAAKACVLVLTNDEAHYRSRFFNSHNKDQYSHTPNAATLGSNLLRRRAAAERSTRKLRRMRVAAFLTLRIRSRMSVLKCVVHCFESVREGLGGLLVGWQSASDDAGMCFGCGRDARGWK